MTMKCGYTVTISIIHSDYRHTHRIHSGYNDDDDDDDY